MATGRFGRRRTSTGQNLSALIAALLREQRQAEDRAAFDAWKNGGEYQGKPMTDARLLAYIKARRDGFTRDDPLWDEWNNSLQQHEFSIGEQKIGLAFKQGKASAGAVAAWYRGQLGKLAKNSAFYREVAGRAADWAKAAAGAARGAARSRANAGAEAKLDRLRARIEANNSVIAGLEAEARRRGLIWGNMTLADADATDLQKMLASGVVVVNGQTVTFNDWRQAAVSTYNAIGQAVKLNKSIGRGTKELQESRRKYLDNYIVGLNTVDDRAKYETARDLWLERLEDAEGDPIKIAKLNAEYAATLQGIAATALGPSGMNENSAQFIGGIRNEIEALTTGKASGPTAATLLGGPSDDAETTAAGVVDIRDAIKSLNDGTAYYGQTEPGGPMYVVDDPWRSHESDPSYTSALIRGPDGVVRRVVLVGRPVKAAVLVPPVGTGKSELGLAGEEMGRTVSRISGAPQDVGPDALQPGPIPNPEDVAALKAQGWTVVVLESPVGYVYSEPTTGKTSYGVVQPDGSIRYTPTNPFSSGVVPYDEGSSIVFSPSTVLTDDGQWVPNARAAVTGNPTGMTPLPLDSTVAPADVQRLMGDTSVRGLDAYKAQELTDYLHQQKTGRAAQRDQYRPAAFDPNVSPAQAGLTAALTGIGQALGPVFKPPTAYSASTPNYSQAYRSQPGRFATPLPPPPTAPKPPAAPKPPKPKPPKVRDDGKKSAGSGIGAADVYTPPPPPAGGGSKKRR